MKKIADVVGLGYCTLDYLTLVNKYPEMDTKEEVIDFLEDGGGPTGTALVTLARFGISTSFIGKIGSDARGELIIQQLRQEGVDLSNLILEKNKVSPLSLIVIDKCSGKRTIIYTKGNVSKIQPEEVICDMLTGARILHVDGHQIEASIPACKWAKERNIKVILDAGSVRPGMEELLMLSDYVLASRTFALAFTSARTIEEAAEKLFSITANTVIVTNGEQGGFCISNKSRFHYSAYKVETVDTTGAGDVFHGAFDYGLLQEWPLERTIQFASIVAGLKCRKMGGRNGIPELKEAIDLMR
jgi:ribokinase